MTELATVPANNNANSPLEQSRKSLPSTFHSNSSGVGENGKTVDLPVAERDVADSPTQFDAVDGDVINEATPSKNTTPAIVGIGSTDATIATAIVGNGSMLSPVDRPDAIQESFDVAEASTRQMRCESTRTLPLDISKQVSSQSAGVEDGEQIANPSALKKATSGRARPDPRADEADLSQLRGMGMRIAEEDKIRSVNKEEDSEDLSALAEIVPGLLTTHQAVRRMSWADTGNEPRSPNDCSEDVWRVREGKNSKSSPGNDASKRVQEQIAEQAEDEGSPPAQGLSTADKDGQTGNGNIQQEIMAESRAADVSGKDQDSDSSSEADAKLPDLKNDDVQGNVTPEMNGIGTDSKEEKKESALSSSISSRKTYSSGNAKDLSSLPSDSGGGVNYDEFAQEAAAKPSKDEADSNTRKGRQKKDKSDRSNSPYEGAAGDETTGSGGRAMMSSSRSLKQSQRSIESEPDEVPAPPPSAQSSSGIPQTMPMYLPTFKPATGCTNASDFIVRCFVARLRSGITVVKHGRSRWCKSRLRILHIHPDGRSLSWKPALGEPTSSKRPPKLDLSTCLEVRHAWSPDPLHPIFTGTPILRQKCEAANAHKSFALIFPRRTVDVTAVTADQCKVLMEGFSALCFRLQVANLAGKKKDGGLDEKGLDKEGSDKGKSSEGRTSSETSSPTNNAGVVRRSRFQ